jgi:hypothetical protein
MLERSMRDATVAGLRMKIKFALMHFIIKKWSVIS